MNRDHSLASIHQYPRKVILDSMLLDEELAYQEVYLVQTMAFVVFFDQSADQWFYNLHDSYMVFEEAQVRIPNLLQAEMDLSIHILPLQYQVLQTSA